MSVTIQNGGNSIKISTQGPAGPQGAQGEQGIQGIQGEPGPAGSNEWGTITGLLSNQTDLNTVLGELETASDNNESNLNTHIADTDIHFSDAPIDGSQYARQDGGWSVVVGGGGANDGDDTDITGLLYGDGASLSAATASQARQAAELDTTDSPTFDNLTLTGDINLPSSNVFSVNGAGRVQLTDLGGTMVEFSNSYFTGFNGGIRLGATAGDITTDVQIARNSANEIRFVQSDGTTRCDLLADNLTLDGDITLSDGAIIDVASGTGTLTIDGDLDITGSLEFDRAGFTTQDSKFYTNGASVVFRKTNSADHFELQGFNQISFAYNNDFGSDTGFSATAAGTVALGNGTLNDTSGTLELANITMSGLLNQFTSTTADPTTTEYPNDGDRGIHKNTTSGNVYLAYNDGGSTIVKVQLT